MQLTEHFSLEEFIFSETAIKHAIDNTPTQSIVKKMKVTADGLELIRAVLGFPIELTSGFRCPELNKLVGGQPNSMHMEGQAADFVCPQFGTPREIALYLKDKMAMLGIDQMILEGTWIHVSFTAHPRGQLLSLKNGKFIQGIV